jgi:hypothetical protein
MALAVVAYKRLARHANGVALRYRHATMRRTWKAVTVRERPAGLAVAAGQAAAVAVPVADARQVHLRHHRRRPRR